VKQVELLLVGMPRNMDGSYGPAALKVEEFVAALKAAVVIPIKLWGRAADFGAGEPVFDRGKCAAGETKGEGGQERRRQFCCRATWTVPVPREGRIRRS